MLLTPKLTKCRGFLIAAGGCCPVCTRGSLQHSAVTPNNPRYHAASNLSAHQRGPFRQSQSDGSRLLAGGADRDKDAKKQRQHGELVAMAQAQGASVQTVDKHTLNQLSGNRPHQVPSRSS